MANILPWNWETGGQSSGVVRKCVVCGSPMMDLTIVSSSPMFACPVCNSFDFDTFQVKAPLQYTGATPSQQATPQSTTSASAPQSANNILTIGLLVAGGALLLLSGIDID